MITDFSPYLKDGVLNLNQEGNKFSSGKGEIRCLDKIFDIGQLAKFIETTPGIKGFKADTLGIGKMGIDNFQLLINAIKESKITAVNFENNLLTLKMVEEISELTNLTGLNLAFCGIDDEKIIKIVKLPKLSVLNVENNGITNIGVAKIVRELPDLLALYASSNCITDIGAKRIADGLNKLEQFTLPYCNDISYVGLKGLVMAHRKTLTKVDLFSSAYTSEQLSKIVELLSPGCVVKLGPYWTKGEDDINDAPLKLVGAEWEILLPVDHVEVVEGDNNALPLVGAIGENNDALPLVDPIGVVEDLQGE
ncbi:hypothetical protein [Candidatus Tisiphia endosymbiont of Ptychoptera albimana]|uniref:hypothetical protein n=1 Tax=Candidatus Tisiphia endosymbiont of Ptychoptera albimana TaxID=3066260 RepID=UPI00312C7630